MTDNRSQASTLGVLMYVYAGIQSLAVLLVLTMLILYGGISIFSFTSEAAPRAEQLVMVIIMFLFYGLMVIFGIVSLFLNIKSGRQLRSETPANKNLIIATSVVNCLGFLCGGICIAPFGIGLGVYGFVFTFSDNGKAYFSGISNIGTPPPFESYYDNSGNLRNL